MNIISRCASLLVVTVALIGAVDARAADVVDAPGVLAIDNDLMRETSATLIDNGVNDVRHEGMVDDLKLQPSGTSGSGIGVGLQIGSPSAITIKFAGLQQSGFVLGVGAGFGFGDRFSSSLWLHGDYLFTLLTLIDSQVNLTFYGGPGIYAQFFGNGYGYGYRGNPYYAGVDFLGFGLRLPFGLSMSFDAAPLEIYLELDPTLSVFPYVGFGVGGSLGFRFHF
ncbi:MAG TPA: DUF3996 domain-containing protein [Myxococcota bacterium]